MTAPDLPSSAVVVLAAGEGRRSGLTTNKALLPLGGKPVFVWGFLAAQSLPNVARRVVVIREEDRAEITAGLAAHVENPDDVTVVLGGATRHESEFRAVEALADSITSGEVAVVAIHDAARPFASPDLFARSIATAAAHGGAIPGRAETALVSLDEQASLPRRLVSVQTPQSFRAVELLEAHRRAAQDGFEATDTAGCLERYVPTVRVMAVDSDATNVKITFPEDVSLAQAMLDASNAPT